MLLTWRTVVWTINIFISLICWYAFISNPSPIQQYGDGWNIWDFDFVEDKKSNTKMNQMLSTVNSVKNIKKNPYCWVPLSEDEVFKLESNDEEKLLENTYL